VLPVIVHRFVAGSYSSALARFVAPSKPPTTSTLPSGSNAAVVKARLRFMLAATLHVPLAGSNNSALTPCEPTARTHPSRSRVAVE
jgi:hypothetical protein